MIIGTAVLITSVTNITPDAITISIWDKNNTIRVTDAIMTDEGSNTYTYIFQSQETWPRGFYKAVIEATSGIYTARSLTTFELEDDI